MTRDYGPPPSKNIAFIGVGKQNQHRSSLPVDPHFLLAPTNHSNSCSFLPQSRRVFFPRPRGRPDLMILVVSEYIYCNSKLPISEPKECQKSHDSTTYNRRPEDRSGVDRETRCVYRLYVGHHRLNRVMSEPIMKGLIGGNAPLKWLYLCRQPLQALNDLLTQYGRVCMFSTIISVLI